MSISDLSSAIILGITNTPAQVSAFEQVINLTGLEPFRFLEGDRIQLRQLDTKQFSYGTDIWTWFRENYEELKSSGAL